MIREKLAIIALVSLLLQSGAEACTRARLDGLDRGIERADTLYHQQLRKAERALNTAKATVPGYAVNIFSFRGEAIHKLDQEMDQIFSQAETAKSTMFDAAARINAACFDGRWSQKEHGRFNAAFTRLKSRLNAVNAKIAALRNI